MTTDTTSTDMAHLRRCLDLAAEALADGDGPFGSVLADSAGNALHEDRNQETSTGDPTAHPEFALARWAAMNLDPETCAGATVYTSGEHCPMCSAAQGWAGVGRVVYIASSEQLTQWRAGWGAGESSVRALPIQEVAPAIDVVGPVPELVEEIRALHQAAAGA
ncbi:nucleoside deaminase [Nocardioides sp. NPDC006273]|uniref:nucleoside deaminase n=1 Tax=Nocardioides sp. NPDC006273 TaxID=3155598 RepID=UPI0033AD3FB3